MGAGFYKQENNGHWLYAPNTVMLTTGVILTKEANQDTVDVEGWTYYPTAPQAYIDWYNLVTGGPQ